MLLTQRGTPFLFAGEELGLQDATVPADRVVDPGGRDGCRAPIPWDATPAHGWPAEPWLPWPPEPELNNVTALQQDPTSVLHLYRRLLKARRGSAALRRGEWKWLASPEGTLAYEREAAGDRRAVIINFTDEAVQAPLEGNWRVEVASDGIGEGKPFGGTVAPSAGLLLAPEGP
jgi:alpha-glucosidase